MPCAWPVSFRVRTGCVAASPAEHATCGRRGENSTNPHSYSGRGCACRVGSRGRTARHATRPAGPFAGRSRPPAGRAAAQAFARRLHIRRNAFGMITAGNSRTVGDVGHPRDAGSTAPRADASHRERANSQTSKRAAGTDALAGPPAPADPERFSHRGADLSDRAKQQPCRTACLLREWSCRAGTRGTGLPCNSAAPEIACRRQSASPDRRVIAERRRHVADQGRPVDAAVESQRLVTRRAAQGNCAREANRRGSPGFEPRRKRPLRLRRRQRLTKGRCRHAGGRGRPGPIHGSGTTRLHCRPYDRPGRLPLRASDGGRADRQPRRAPASFHPPRPQP